tara:strand:- start:98 stop:295 length:198 start_codon:yes stop_codon:yes gene_type:complete
MSRITVDFLYNKILQDVDKYDSGSNKIVYTDIDGIETETTFQVPPSPEELEGLLIWLNKDKLPHA